MINEKMLKAFKPEEFEAPWNAFHSTFFTLFKKVFLKHSWTAFKILVKVQANSEMYGMINLKKFIELCSIPWRHNQVDF